MAKLRRGCRRICLILIAFFVCGIISTILNAFIKPQVDATRTAEAGIGQTAIAANIVTASVVALTPSNTPTATFTPSITFTPSATAKLQIVPTNTAAAMIQATASIVAPKPSTPPLPSSTPLPTKTPTITFTSQADATRAAEAERGLTAIAANIATASSIALTPLSTTTPSITFTPSITPAPTSDLLAFDRAVYEKEMTAFLALFSDTLDVQLVLAEQIGGKTTFFIGYVTKSSSKRVDYVEAVDLFRTVCNGIINNKLKVDEVTAVVYDATHYNYMQGMKVGIKDLNDLCDFNITDEAFTQILIKSADS